MLNPQHIHLLRSPRPAFGGRVLVSGAAVAMVLAGCSTVTPGHATAAGGASSSAGSSSAAARSSALASPSPAPSGVNSATDGATLAALITACLKNVTSVHSVTNVVAGGQTITSTTDSQLSNGKPTAAHISETVAGLAIEIVEVNNVFYGKLPKSIVATTAAKPWVLLTIQSKNATVKAIASGIDSSEASGLNSASVYATAAKSVSAGSKVSINGTPATQVTATIDVSQLPGSAGTALSNAGVTTFESDFWITDDNQLLQTQQSFVIKGQTTVTTTTFSNFNAPLTIAAPTPDQITPT